MWRLWFIAIAAALPFALQAASPSVFESGHEYLVYQCDNGAGLKRVMYIEVGKTTFFDDIVSNGTPIAGSQIEFKDGRWIAGEESTVGAAARLYPAIYSKRLRLVTAEQFTALYAAPAEEKCTADPPPQGLRPLTVDTLRKVQSPNAISVVGDELVKAIAAHDDKKIVGLFTAKYAENLKGELPKEYQDHLYRGDFHRLRFDKRAKSVSDLIRMGGLHQVTYLRGDEQAAVSFFVPQQYWAEAESNPQFYAENYLVKYFACQFEKSFSEKAWKLAPLCFFGLQSPGLNP